MTSIAPPAHFADPAMEALFATVVALASEVYVLRERLARLEAAAPPPPLDPAAEASLRKDAEAFVGHVFGALTAPSHAEERR